MNNFNILTFKKARILSLIMILFILTAVITTQSAETASTLTLTMSTDKPGYHLRQKITITGNLTSDSSPIENALVAVEIKDPRNNPFYFRTIPIGNPSETWAINITDFSLKDPSENPLTKTTPNSEVKACVTIKNELLNPLDVTTAITICDENLIPLFSGWSASTLPGRDSSTIKWILEIPGWAKPGKALVFINAYNGLPENQGVPYTPERIDYFYIVRNLLLEPSYPQQQVSFNSSAGRYEVYLSAPPDRYTRPGTYMVHAVGRISPAVRIYNIASLQLNPI